MGHDYTEKSRCELTLKLPTKGCFSLFTEAVSPGVTWVPLGAGDRGIETQLFNLGPLTHSSALRNLSMNLISIIFFRVNLESCCLGSLPYIPHLPPYP